MAPSAVWDEATAATYDEDSSDMFAPSVLDPTVAFLERLARPHGALELAIGTGRVGIPLAARGVQVTGIELSVPMVDRLRRKVDASVLPVVVGDMATTHVPGAFSLVYLVFNALSNLPTQAEQVRCFQNAARHLDPGGHFVIELWVPQLRRLPPGKVAVPFDVRDGHLGFDTYDTVSQGCTSHHYHRAADGTVRYGAGTFRYAWPSECDLMAMLAGMELESRVADWDGSPFTAESEKHVSTWRKP
jgi:SAM-dependent methyltransferase